jgi:MFS family permease
LRQHNQSSIIALDRSFFSWAQGLRLSKLVAEGMKTKFPKAQRQILTRRILARRVLVGMVHFRRSWAPLSESLFRRVWFATLVSDVGSWMHEIAGAWLMTSLTASPLMISLMQTATFLPMLIIGLPAGAIADMADRRKIVLWGQFWMLLAAATLGVCTVCGLTTPWLLLGLTLVLGAGAASSAPAYGGLVPELVPQKHLHSALAIRSSGRHLARGIGSALGGAVLALFGAGAVFFLNACSFAGILGVIWRWQAKFPSQPKMKERQNLMSAIWAGIDYTIKNKPLLTTDILTAVFGISSSALWALLPLFARKEMGLTAVQYGQVLGLFGLGSLAGVTWLAWLRKAASYQGAAAIGVVAYAISVASIAAASAFVHVGLAALLGGIAWIIVISALNTVAQLAAGGQMRSRSLALFTCVWQTSVAVGSVLWGLLACVAGVRATLIASALTLLIDALIFLRAKSFVTVTPDYGEIYSSVRN